VTVAHRFIPKPTAAMKLPAFFEEDRIAVDASLDRLLPPESTQPSSIHQAMRYSVLAGGKRIRPTSPRRCIPLARSSLFTPIR
jgi:hypothetical protein